MEQQPTPEATYVFDNTEIYMTGRKAERKLSSGKLDKLVEITPLHQSSGQWRKWVKESDLYEITKD